MGICQINGSSDQCHLPSDFKMYFVVEILRSIRTTNHIRTFPPPPSAIFLQKFILKRYILDIKMSPHRLRDAQMLLIL